MNDKTYCKWESASTFYFSLWFFPFKRPPFLFFSFFLFSRYTYFFHTYPFNNPVTYFMTKKQIYCIMYNVQIFKIYTRIFHLIYFPAFMFSSSFQWSYISVHTRIRHSPVTQFTTRRMGRSIVNHLTTLQRTVRQSSIPAAVRQPTNIGGIQLFSPHGENLV